LLKLIHDISLLLIHVVDLRSHSIGAAIRRDHLLLSFALHGRVSGTPGLQGIRPAQKREVLVFLVPPAR